ncbi:N-acetylmuramoyl-L-alanine amidase [Lactobacillus sp. LC28-10]|uniref:N-acetylmuramoyl-L-alanine amidase n=1 Tax=Secundilactobacillus angelensis TaxID=2722706 RepID=A0ABX1L0B7_9LACO|nr:peptidoglycan recognition family protein [Secundilactobacillus angelensis]MCH5462028.1 N-acetylmuramoyl-L-alanine amidase [Secundilactobacillus angelensis]NLR18950.1 N-acetylmuramoyl-L-alanine amidase [Secundilactobacillus angelensis]
MTEFQPALAENYTTANRPTDVNIHYIVIHATELSYQETIDRFQSSNHVSAHTVIRQQDGHRAEMVAPENIAWHAGNWDINCRSLGIEQEAYVEDDASYTAAMIDALVTQILEWSQRYKIPLNRAHLLGHDNVPAPTPEAVAQMHVDPGWYFDWEKLFLKLGITADPYSPVKVGQGIRITSNYADLLQQPSTNSQKIGSGVDKMSHRVSYGQEFVCVAQQGDWIAIIFDGQQAWLRRSQVVGVQRPILTVGDKPLALYGSTQLGAPAIATLVSGEQYVISDQLAGIKTTDAMGHLTAETTGNLFDQIWYNHRIGYVKVSKK